MKIIPCIIFGVFQKFGKVAENDFIINFFKIWETPKIMQEIIFILYI